MLLLHHFLLYFYYVFSYSAIQPQVCNKLSVQTYTIIARDHCFPRHAEFWAEPRNLPVARNFYVFAELGTGQ